MIRVVALLAAASVLPLGCATRPEQSFWAACKEEVQSRLKAPRTAVFASKPAINIVLKSGKALIVAEVDSQNSFGAMLRSKFQCMRHFGSDTNDTISVVFMDPEALSSRDPQKWVPQLAAMRFMTDIIAEERAERQ